MERGETRLPAKLKFRSHVFWRSFLGYERNGDRILINLEEFAFSEVAATPLLARWTSGEDDRGLQRRVTTFTVRHIRG